MRTLSGAPQGGVCRPILSNIYLDKLDKFVETVLMPKYNCGKKRTRNPNLLEWCRIADRLNRNRAAKTAFVQCAASSASIERNNCCWN